MKIFLPLFAAAISTTTFAAETSVETKRGIICEATKLRVDPKKTYTTEEGPVILDYGATSFEITSGTETSGFNLLKKVTLLDDQIEVTLQVKDSEFTLLKLSHDNVAATGVTPNRQSTRTLLSERSTQVVYDVTCKYGNLDQ